MHSPSGVTPPHVVEQNSPEYAKNTEGSAEIWKHVKIDKAVQMFWNCPNLDEAVFTYCYEAVQGVNVSKVEDREKVSPLYGLCTTEL